MLTLHIEKREFYDGVNELFLYTDPLTVRLEHSLISISKWESHWHKPYLPGPSSQGMQGYHEELHYIECMIIGKVPDAVPTVLYLDHREAVYDYIANPYTASKVHNIKESSRPALKTITSELVYFWMIRFGIPFECERWHFNRLLALIEVCNLKMSEESGKNKMNAADSARYRWELNKARMGKQ